MNVDEFIMQCCEIVDSLIYDEDLHYPKDIGLSERGNEFYYALILVDAIKTVQGTDKVYIGHSINNKDEVRRQLINLGSCLNDILENLHQKNDKFLTRSEVTKVITDNKEDEYDYYTIIGILTSLGAVTSAGRGRAGGIKYYDKSIDASKIKNALAIITNQGDETQQSKAKEENESSLYPSAERTISGLGFQALTMGKVRRLSGEWNTPDVIGYRIKRFKNIGGAEIEIVTVEVKWDITKLAIAETNSHQRLAHKSYLMVHQTFEDINKDLLPDLLLKGIGLICRKDDEHKIYLPARRNNPDKLDIDEFLGIALEYEYQELENVKRELAKIFYSDFLKPLLPN